MLRLLSLRWRILILIGCLALINITGSMVTIWYGYRSQDLNRSMVDQDLTALIAAQELAYSLVMQKGLLTYFFMTDSPKWLKQLTAYHQNFQTWLARAREANQSMDGNNILNEIESRYIRFVFDRENVIKLYEQDRREEGAAQHWGVRDQFFKIHELTRAYKQLYKNTIMTSSRSLRDTSRNLSYLAVVATPCVIFLSLLLTFFLFRHVLNPIRRLALDVDLKEIPHGLENEVESLKDRVHHLIADIGRTQAKLQESQEHLIQSEKLAMVGKLAAGVAHSVRNPLTSLKMRLFTLERSLHLTPEQKEDLEVISEEIRHIDTILRNFLEYARPPKLNCQPQSPSEVVDHTTQLLKHRIESYRTDLSIVRTEKLPEVMLDSDQLKEVLVNLIINACEAMGEKGRITIIEKIEEGVVNGESFAVIKVKDNGPGIPAAIQEKIFQPFYSSKEEGSGLGLSIAKRIVAEHGGELQVESDEGLGAVFSIRMPIKESPHGHHTDR